MFDGWFTRWYKNEKKEVLEKVKPEPVKRYTYEFFYLDGSAEKVFGTKTSMALQNKFIRIHGDTSVAIRISLIKKIKVSSIKKEDTINEG